MLANRHPAWRWRESGSGLCMERENLGCDAKGEVQAGGPCKDESTDAQLKGRSNP